MRRRIAVVLLHVASGILPASRREWLRDMRRELDYAESDALALEWAIGCLSVSLQERVRAMWNSTGRISRPVLVLEWLMCFGPLTLLWAVALSIIVRHGAAVETVVPTLFGTLGPIGLCVTMYATFSKSRGPRWLPLALVAASVTLVAWQLGNAVALGRHTQWFASDLQVFVLLSLLPLVGALHLMQLSRRAAAV